MTINWPLIYVQRIYIFMLRVMNVKLFFFRFQSMSFFIFIIFSLQISLRPCLQVHKNSIGYVNVKRNGFFFTTGHMLCFGGVSLERSILNSITHRLFQHILLVSTLVGFSFTFKKSFKVSSAFFEDKCSAWD